MALKPKHPHICIDEQIWDDPVMIGIPAEAFRAYIFAIAWSKSQNGRTPDGLLTHHGLSRVGATLEILQILTEKKLLEKREDGYKIVKYEEWQKTSEEERMLAERAAVKSELGKSAAAARWNKPSPVVEDGFEVEVRFEEAWGAWPEPSDPKFTEKREDALEAFAANITNSKDFKAFEQALMKRIHSYEREAKPKAERRKFLGAFKNFCNGRWRDWIPKDYRSDGSQPESPPAPEATPEPPPTSKFPPRGVGIAANVTDEELLSYLNPSQKAG